jgi:ABC-type phosphate transport system substrate-binding protein
MAELAGVLVGNFFLLECLAREGMVETYRARPTTRGGFDVVLRLFRPEFPDATSFREHFASEVEKVWHCHHEHIQPLFEFGTGDDLLYCATLCTEAETLEHFLKRQPEQYLPVPLVVRFMTQLCAALHTAHEHGIVHGNIQPSSILLQNEEHLLLTHFGMKRAYQDGEPLVAQIQEGNAAYTAPEQALGMVRSASDIYALGVLLYRLLTGTLPYDDRDAGEIALKHTNEPIPSLRSLRPELPEALELVVYAALSKSPEARFLDASALAQALHSALIPEGQQVVPSTPERRIAVRSRRTRFTWSRAASLLTLSVLLFSLLGASFFVLSLPPGLTGLPGLSFLNFRHSRILGHPPGSSSTTVHVTPTMLPVTPTTGLNFPNRPAPTGVVSQNPIARGTAIVTPPTTPTTSSFRCVSGSLSMDGSQSLGVLLQQANSDYQKACPDMTISLTGNGSRSALNSLQQNTVDVAASDLTARPTRNLADHAVAAMLYTLIVSPDVQIGTLSSATIQDIYQGRITNWSQVGGPDEAITVFQHSSNDTVAAIFRAFVLNGISEHVRGTRLRNDWVQAVAQTPGAISYVSLADAQAASVSIVGIDGVLPSLQALQQGAYPFWSVEHLYTQGDGTPQFQAYLSFLRSTQENTVFAQDGAVPMSAITPDVLSSHLPGSEI